MAVNDKVNITIQYYKSAFKHGVTEKYIIKAVINVAYDDILDEFDNKYLLIGFDGNGNLLEIVYNVIDVDTIRVFHAMKCRDSFIALLKMK